MRTQQNQQSDDNANNKIKREQKGEQKKDAMLTSKQRELDEDALSIISFETRK